MHSMYSGSDSTESQKYPQWALNPSTYQNMANDQVDWAALAQQWIIMKEAGPPPIPGEQPVVLNNKTSKERPSEGGEAPMEVVNDKEEPPAWNVSEPPPPPGAEAWNWNAQSQSWNWNNSWVPPSGVPPPPTIGPMKSALLPTPNNMYSAPPESSSDNAVPFGGYNTGSNNEYNNTSYWTGSNNHKHIKPHNKRYSKVNVPIRATAPIPPMPVPLETPPPPALDAAKRKQLPAWIREGLEKMEKDKLKQLEKDKEKQVRDEFLEKNKQNEKETMEILKTTMKERQRSKFESDGENSDSGKDVRRKAVTPEPIPLTQDELMLRVRRMMTEVLLNVTNRQIEAICKEEHQRFLKKYKASDHRSSAPSGANISARLVDKIIGLGIYGGGSGSSSEEDDDEYQRNDKDSDSELKDTIKRKMAEFQKTEREIEEKLEEAERRKAGSASRSASPESMDNDSQVDARAQGRKYTDEKSPPRSRNFHDKSRARSISSSSEGSVYSNNRSKNSRRSSSSDSNNSHKKSKKHHSRSRSRSLDKKRQNSLSSRWSRSRSPPKRHSRSDSRSRRDSNGSRKKSTRRSRSRSYSRSRRSRSSSYRKSKRSRTRSRSRGRFRRTRSRERSTSRSRYSKRSRSRSNSRRSRKRRSRSSSSGRGKRSHRH